MSKKNKTLLLVGAVLVIYGFVFQRVYNNWFAPEAEEETSTAVTPNQKHKAQAPKNYHLIADYKDPFLGHTAPVYAPTQPEKTQIKKTNNNIPPPPKEEYTWPEITYKGMIKNQNSEKALAIITINGKEKIVSPGESFGEITVSGINKEGIIFVRGKVKKVVSK